MENVGEEEEKETKDWEVKDEGERSKEAEEKKKYN